MESTLKEEIYQTCRCCLSSLTETQPIFESIPALIPGISISELLWELSITVDENDEFPKSFCMECLNKLVSAYEFLNTWKRSQEALKHSTNPDYKEEKLEHESEEEFCSDDKFIDSNSIQFSLVEESLLLNKAHKDKTLKEPDNLPASESEDTTTENKSPKKRIKISNRYNIAKCPMCPQKFSTYSDLSVHLGKTHTNVIKCNLCPTIFKTARMYVKHYGLAHKYTCDLCQKTYSRAPTLQRHLRVHYSNDRAVFSCEICHRNFHLEDSFKYHLRTQHNDRFSFTCEVCGLAFKTDINLNYHKKKHAERKFLCTYCGKGFLQSIHLKYHIRGHTGEKPFKCNICEEKAYATGDGLRKHQYRCKRNQKEAK